MMNGNKLYLHNSSNDNQWDLYTKGNRFYFKPLTNKMFPGLTEWTAYFTTPPKSGSDQIHILEYTE